MWFNGTAISNKAQRALRNENITIVAHSSGYVHCLYKDATIDKKLYQDFSRKLDSYLSAKLSLSVFANFLRSNRKYQKFFQVCRECHGQAQFLKAEVLFHYEHGSNYRVADKTFDKLLADISDEDFVPYELPGRIRCDLLEEFMEEQKPDIKSIEGKTAFRQFIGQVIPEAQRFVEELADFIHIEAKLPSSDKNFLPAEPIEISVEQSREQIIDYLKHVRQSNTTAELAFYSYRDMESCNWLPFVKAAVQRNPVSIQMVKAMSIKEIYAWLEQMKDDSIYDGRRLAQPDEVANYKTGDGIEKALLLANVIRERNLEQDVEIIADKEQVILKGRHEHRFVSNKNIEKSIIISTNGKIAIGD